MLNYAKRFRNCPAMAADLSNRIEWNRFELNRFELNATALGRIAQIIASGKCVCGACTRDTPHATAAALAVVHFTTLEISAQFAVGLKKLKVLKK